MLAHLVVGVIVEYLEVHVRSVYHGVYLFVDQNAVVSGPYSLHHKGVVHSLGHSIPPSASPNILIHSHVNGSHQHLSCHVGDVSAPYSSVGHIFFHMVTPLGCL